MQLTTELWSQGGLCVLALFLVGWRPKRPGTLKPAQAGQMVGVRAVVALAAGPAFS